MLLEDRFQLLDFFAEPLAFGKGAFQSGSKIALILHEEYPVQQRHAVRTVQG